MQLQLYRLAFLLVSLAAAGALSAQVNFSATISSSIIGKDEVAELKLMVSNAGNVDQITPPSLSSFIVISGPNQVSSSSIINGVTQSSIGITYLLKPKAAGDFTIGAAVAKADGKELRSNTVKIKVVKGVTGNGVNRSSPFSGMMDFEEPPPERSYNDYILKKDEKVEDKISKNLFIRVETDKTSCYVGEPVLVTYKLYTRLKSESGMSKSPAFNGFSVIDLVRPQAGGNFTIEKYNGRNYNVSTLRKAQLYPLQAGVAVLEAASVENSVHFIKAEYVQRSLPTDLFGDLLPGALPAEAMVDEKVTIESKPVEITVKPLPDLGKPASFNGAVGNFMIDDVLEKDSLTTDDAGKLKLLLSGEGNFTLVPSPEITWPAGLEGYDPTVKEGLNRLSVPVSGSKIFDYPFTFAAAGIYTIPPVEFSFFDLVSGRYKTVSTKPITVHVKKGTGKRPVIAATDNRSRRESFFEMIFTRRWMIVLPVVLLVITGLLIWLKKDRKDQQRKQALAVEKVVDEKMIEPEILQNPLAQTEAALLKGEAPGFYGAINKDLHDFLKTKLNLSPEQVNRKYIAAALDRAGAGAGDSLAVQQLLDEVSRQLYTPFADEAKMQDCFAEAMRLVDVLNKL